MGGPYLFVQSRDTGNSRDGAVDYALAIELAKTGHVVTLLLVEDGVLTARRSAEAGMVRDASQAGVEILVDTASLRERGISAAKLADGVRVAKLDELVERIADGQKAVWL